MDDYGDVCDKTQILSQMRCETTSSVKECALRARSTHGVHHAIVEVNMVIGVVLGEVLVARVVPLVVDAVIGLALSLIAHVVVVVFVVAILHRIFCMGDILFTVFKPLGQLSEVRTRFLVCENVLQRKRRHLQKPIMDSLPICAKSRACLI